MCFDFIAIETDQTSSGFEETLSNNNQSRSQLTTPRSPRFTTNQPPTAIPPVPPRVPSRTCSRTSSQKSPNSSHDGNSILRKEPELKFDHERLR